MLSATRRALVTTVNNLTIMEQGCGQFGHQAQILHAKLGMFLGST